MRNIRSKRFLLIACPAVALFALFFLVMTRDHFLWFEPWRSEDAIKVVGRDGLEYTVAIFWRAHLPRDFAELKLQAKSMNRTTITRYKTHWSRCGGVHAEVVAGGFEVYPKMMRTLTNNLTGEDYRYFGPGLRFEVQDGKLLLIGEIETESSRSIP